MEDDIQHSLLKSACWLSLALLLCAGCAWKGEDQAAGSAIGTATALDEKPSPTVNEISAPSQGFTLVGDGNFRIVHAGEKATLLFTQASEADMEAMMEKLVDKEVRPMSKEELEKLNNNPDAHPVDNMLPDGRYLVENWLEQLNEMSAGMRDESTQVWTIRGNDLGEPLEIKRLERTLEYGEHSLLLRMMEVSLQNGSVIIPRELDHFPIPYVMLPNGERSFVYNEQGIWTLDAESEELVRVSSDTYDGETWLQLAERISKARPLEALDWNGGVLPSPDSKNLVYTSNKHNWKSGGNALFVYDIAAAEEKLVAYEPGASYEVIGWLNNERAICTKIVSNQLNYVVVDIRGEAAGLESRLELRGNSPSLLAVREGMIAYATTMEGGGGEYAITRIGESEAGVVLEEVAAIPMDGRIRIRASNPGFSPDGRYVAFLYVPDAKPDKRYIQIYDLQTHHVEDIKEVQGDPAAIIKDYNWADDAALVLRTEEGTGEHRKSSIWLYNLHNDIMQVGNRFGGR